MKTLLLKHKFLLVVILTVIISLIYAFYSQKNKKEITQPEPSPSPAKQATYETLVPGASGKYDVIEKLGEPDASEDEGNILKYNSSNPNVPTEIVLEEDKVSIIKEVITLSDKKYISDIKNEYGETQNKLYGPDSASGFYLYVLSENGIAYVGHEESGLLLEVWYFKPMSFEEFKSKYGVNYKYTTSPSKQY